MVAMKVETSVCLALSWAPGTQSPQPQLPIWTGGREFPSQKGASLKVGQPGWLAESPSSMPRRGWLFKAPRPVIQLEN